MTKAKTATRRARRTQAEIRGLCDQMIEIVRKDKPMTVRQVFYQMVSAGLIDKTEQEYDGTVGRLLIRLRRHGEIPYSWIADNTRWMRKPTSYDSLGQALDRTVETYRRNLWADQDTYVEVWLEKDALSGVLYPITSKFDVPLMVTKGFCSHSFLYGAAETIRDQGKPSYLYYLGDHDPSGVVIPRKVEATLREFAPDADITFERIAVNPDQIEAFRLPTRPTKKTDSRSKSFEGESVEVDAIPPNSLRRLVESSIIRHIDPDVWGRLLAIEGAEKQSYYDACRKFDGA